MASPPYLRDDLLRLGPRRRSFLACHERQIGKGWLPGNSSASLTPLTPGLPFNRDSKTSKGFLLRVFWNKLESFQRWLLDSKYSQVEDFKSLERMVLFSQLDVPAVALTSALSLATAAYLNAKLCISTDVSSLLNRRSYGQRIGEHISQLGETATIYGILERVIKQGHGEADALWFENKTWSYKNLKDC